MDVKALVTKYPQGAERQLIYAVTKRAINSSMLPADAGCIVDNVETLIGIHNAVICGRPLTERIVTVSGDAVESPGNFRVLLGTNHRELIEAAGGNDILSDIDASWTRINWETVVERNPEVIVIVDYSEVTAEQKQRFLETHPALQSVDAIRHKRFIVIPYVQATPGIDNVLAIQTLAKGFHPQ